MYDAETAGPRIERILCYQSTTETHRVLDAKIFIDCTGNGTLSFLAGAEYRTGSEGKAESNEPHAPDMPNAERMGNSLLFKAVDRGQPVEFKTPEWAWHFTEEQLKHRKHADAKPIWGVSEDKNGVVMLEHAEPAAKGLAFDAYCLDYGYWWVELTGSSADIIDDYEKLRNDLVGAIYGIWDHLKNGGDHGAQNYELLWVGMLPGVRESRRVVGDYILTENDIISNRVFEDAVAYGGWPVDNHPPNGLLDFDKLPSFIYPIKGAYTIPYRSYCARNIDNLYVAGRMLSASKLAMASTRVMGTCAVGGQAAGVAAALCVERGILPRELGHHIGELQQELLKDDCYIPGYRNTDPGDLALKAKVTASSFVPGREPEKVINGVSRNVGKQINYWESNGISPAGETLSLELASPAPVNQVRLTFDTNLCRSIKITLSSKRIAEQKKGVPEELVSDYRVTLWKDGKSVAEKEVRGNYQRLNVLWFDKVLCDQVTVTCSRTRGSGNIRVFEARIY
jgi:hypothetical protein